jgi:hypothetical protein
MPEPRAQTEQDLSEEGSEANSGTLDAASLARELSSASLDRALEIARLARSELKDLALCYDAYRAAAALGNVDALYAAALFELQGRASHAVAASDAVRTGVSSLRRAADGGHILARVYLGNAYETGSFGLPRDVEKATTWYQAAARSADIDTSDESALAQLGCGRFARIIADADSTNEVGIKVLKKAKTLGFVEAPIKAQGGDPEDEVGTSPLRSGVRTGASAESSDHVNTAPIDLASTDGEPNAPNKKTKKPASATPDAKAKPKAAPDEEETASKNAASKTKDVSKSKPVHGHASRAAAAWAGLVAFFYASLFFIAAWGVGLGARALLNELPATGTSVPPSVMQNPQAIMPAALALVFVMPLLFLFRFRALLASLGFGGIFALFGFYASESGRFTWIADLVPLFFAAGTLAALLVLGLLGAAKAKPSAKQARL